MQLLMEIIGWIGGILILLSYGALSLGKVTDKSMSYKLANLIGAFLLVIFTVYKEAYPPATVNAIWTMLALRSLLKDRIKKSKCKHDWHTDNRGKKHCMICHNEE